MMCTITQAPLNVDVQQLPANPPIVIVLKAAETLVLAAEARKRAKEFETAVGLLDRAIAHYGVNAGLLNATGECYEGLGKPGEALAAYEKSLQLSPDQTEIRKRVEALKKTDGARRRSLD